MIAANRSATIMPLTRTVFSRSPVVMVAVRSATISGFALPATSCCLENHAIEAKMRASAAQIQTPNFRGFSGAGGSNCGGADAVSGAAGRLLGNEALLMWYCMRDRAQPYSFDFRHHSPNVV